MDSLISYCFLLLNSFLNFYHYLYENKYFEIKETHSNPFNFYFQIEISIEELMT